jgi:putative SOS response-associated peptidase YedK
MQGLALGIPTHQSEIDLPPRDDVRIRDLAPMMRVAGNGVELAAMRWGFPPGRPGAGPVFNFRSEGRKFDPAQRCLAPASAFYEFTGAKSPKAKHRFTLIGEPFMAIAGYWRPAKDGGPPDFTLLTTSPGPDVAPYHDRQIVVLKRADWPAWLYGVKPDAELLRPLAGGSLKVERNQPVKVMSSRAGARNTPGQANSAGEARRDRDLFD